ncbi:prenyltransferase/squalene oxidase repeat-containing protein [Thermodesulfobacteriota bacterium]
MRMRTFIIPVFFAFCAVACLQGRCCAQQLEIYSSVARENISLKKEVEHALQKGLTWLQASQNQGGFWSQPEHPALTGLVLTAFMREPSGRYKADPPACVQNGYAYMSKTIQPDGGIYVKDLANYNTAICMMALQAAYNPAYKPVIRNARNFLVGLQTDEGGKGKADQPYDGGIGYGMRYRHSDMSNTMFALEALHYTRFLAHDEGKDSEFKELNWPAAIKFIERCQNLPGTNDQPWASDDPQNRGGFIYFPGDSKAGETTLPSGKKALRSYGSISYAGLLSYMYAELTKEDPRVQAVVDWLSGNFTLEENPGMGKQGLFYYYHTMAKALAVYGVHDLNTKGGTTVNWRKALALKLLDLQNGDGSWVNENGRWWERDPVLVTAYAIITLEIVHRGL